MIELSVPMLLGIVLAAVVVGLWYDSARAREAANRIAFEACRRRSLQLLDGTVALASLRPRLGRGGLRLERTYVFDYAVDGAGRSTGFLIMLGHEMQHFGLESGRAA